MAKTTTNDNARKSSGKTDAIALLRKDHSEVAKMFKEFEDGKDDMSSDEKDALATRICDALTVHATIEEEIFYPTVRPEIEDDELMDEAEVEHGSLKELIAKIQQEGSDGELFDAYVKVLGEYVTHHVKEEEGEMFKEVEESEIDLEELGAKMQERKQELSGENDNDTDSPPKKAASRR
jgi:hemerythrin superfamily protein